MTSKTEQQLKKAEYDKAYNAANRQKRADRWKSYYAENKEKISLYQREYVETNRHKMNEYARAYYAENKARIISQVSVRRAAKKESMPPKPPKPPKPTVAPKLKKPKAAYNSSEYYRARYLREREHRISMAIKYEAVRMKTDPLFKLKKNTRRLVLKTFEDHGFSKTSKTAEILGCSFEFFRNYLEQRFLPGMTWSNRKEWHLDHIIPSSSATNEKQLIKLNHHTNFQPLWAKDNLSKGDKMTKQLTLLAA
jgi:hypothetical protein